MRLKTLWALAACLLCFTALSARADVIFTITGTFTDGGTLSGTFTTNNALTAITGANISLGAKGAFTATTIVYPHTSPTTTLLQSLPTQYFQLSESPYLLQISLSNTGPLSTTNPIVVAVGSSYETQTGAGNRYLSSATIRAGAPPTPEPSSLILLGTGVLGVAGAVRKRFNL